MTKKDICKLKQAEPIKNYNLGHLLCYSNAKKSKKLNQSTRDFLFFFFCTKEKEHGGCTVKWPQTDKAFLNSRCHYLS